MKKTLVLLFAIGLICAGQAWADGAKGGSSSGSGWTLAADCTSTTTNGVGCYNTATHAFCIGDGAACQVVSAGSYSISAEADVSAGVTSGSYVPVLNGATQGKILLSTFATLYSILGASPTGNEGKILGVDNSGNWTLKSTVNITLGGFLANSWVYADSSGNIQSKTITASKPVCTGTDGLPAVCAGTEGVWTPASGTGIVERIGATFDGGGSAVAVNKTAMVHMPFAGTINQWTMVCDVNTGASGITIDLYKDAYASDSSPSTTMCASGTKPNVASGAHQTGQANWDCNVTTITAGDVIQFKVTTAPTSATWCSVSLKITR
jgi:hypothetical protein